MPTLYELAGPTITYPPGGGRGVLRLSDGRFLRLLSTSPTALSGDIVDAYGAPTGTLFTLSPYGYEHSVAALGNGGFAFAYHDNQISPNGSHEIYLAIFNGAGSQVVPTFQVNTHSNGVQASAKIAVTAAGHIVVTWTDHSGATPDGDSAVRARMFNPDGSAFGGEFLVNTTTVGNQYMPTIVALAGGGFVVSWLSEVKTGNFQVFDANGAKLGPERAVTYVGTDSSHHPVNDIKALSNGGFAMTYVGGVNNQSVGVLAVFDAAGNQIALHTSFPSTLRIIGAFDGGFVAAGGGINTIFDDLGVQQGVGFPASLDNVFPAEDGAFKSFTSGGVVVIRPDDGTGGADVAPSAAALSETTPQNNVIASLSTSGAALNSSYTYEILSDSLGGAFQIIGNRLILADNGSLDFETATTISVTVAAIDLNGNQYVDTLTFNVTDEAVEQRITASPALPPLGGATAPLAFDRLLSVRSDSNGVHGQIFDADLNLIKSFEVADPILGFSIEMEVLAQPAGGFVLTWRAAGGDGLSEGIVARIFDAEANPLTAVFTVNTPTVQTTRNPDIVLLGSGEFVIAWEENGGDGGGQNGLGLRAQRFSAAGAEIGPEFILNTAGLSNQQLVSLHPLGTGGFLATWTDSSGEGGDASGSSIKGQLFDSSAQRIGGEFLVNTVTTGSQSVSDAITLASGQILVTWAGAGIRGQLFDAAGAKIGGELALEPGGDGGRAVALPSGGFALAWVQAGLAPDLDAGVWARLFNADGSPAGSKFLVNTNVDGPQGLVDLEVLPGGELYIAWSSSSPTPSQARIFDLTGTRTDWSVDDRLAGTPGADMLRGGTGNDIYVVNHPGDVAIELVGEGVDIVYSSISYSLTDAYEVESLATFDWDSTEPLNLTGNSLANTLIGNAGANQLNGAAGADIMFGREGNDIYIVDNVGDQPTEYAGEGIDTVYSSISYTLAAGTDVEGLATLDWGSTAPLSLTGNGLANTLIGNAGGNQLDGAGGADVMVGREGNDIYLVDNAGDKAFESAGQGYDVIYTGVSFALTNDQSLEGLSTINWLATDAINLTGNSADNYLIGNAGANVLNGGAGNDVLHGKEGADTYQFTALLGPTNVDLILEYSSADDTIALDNNGIFTGLADGALPASAFVIGSAAQDGDDRIVYNQATGQLFFDADGSGAGAQVQFALLSGAPPITANDFTVI